jgi:mono/diheme cytochrome c family protein
MIREPLLLAALLALFSLTACRNKESFSNAELEGQRLYDTHCYECHENPHPDLHKQPPNLHGLFQSKAFPSGLPATDEQARKTIIDGRGTMPAFDRRLREEEARDLVKYLRKLE